MSRMRIAIASPTSAPATATGVETSWPPRIDGVIIGPQQPGVVLTTMWPPSATGPAIGTSGPSRPSVKVSTKTVRWAWVVVGGVWMAAMRGLLRLRLSPGHRRDERELLARAQRAVAPGVDAGDDGQGGGQVVGQHGLVRGQARERVGNGRAVVELESDDGRDGQP